MQENTTNPKALLNVKELCAYLGIGQTKARELLTSHNKIIFGKENSLNWHCFCGSIRKENKKA